MIPGIDNTVRADSCDILMLGPLGGHVVGIWAGLGDRVNSNPGGGEDPDKPNPDKPNPDKPDFPGPKDDSDDPNGGGDKPKDSPKTGDNSHYELLWVIAVIALTTFAATYRKKND